MLFSCLLIVSGPVSAAGGLSDPARAALIPSDTRFNSQWYLSKIKASAAWNTINQSPNIIIAVIDSGVQIDHPDLKDNIWRNKKEKENNRRDDDKNGFIDDMNGWDFVAGIADPNPKFDQGWTLAGVSHGTIVAGIIAAAGNNAVGVSGITWKAQIMPLRVLDDRGQGRINDVTRAIDYAVTNGADIINLSFNSFDYSQAMNEAIRRAYQAGVIVVAAAGNELGDGQGVFLDEKPLYPVCYDGSAGENRVIGVAATDTLDQKTAFSGYGSRFIDLSAPGISIYSTMVYSPGHAAAGQPLDKFYDGYWSGTSVATPMVSAAIALIEAANPKYSRNQVIRTLLETTDNLNRLNPKYFNQLGKGRLNLENAVKRAKSDLERTVAKIAYAPWSGGAGVIRLADQDGAASSSFEAFAAFRGGVSLAAGDVDGDGRAEIITAPGPGGGPQIKIFTADGKLIGQFPAFSAAFRGGVSLAAGDVDGDGRAEIIAAPETLEQPIVKIFNAAGKLKKQFLAYKSAFRGGVSLAAGDVDGDGRAEIITGAGPGGGPHVKVFKDSGALKYQFMAYDPRFTGGVKVAAADIDGKPAGKRAEIITAPGPGGGPHIRVFSYDGKIRSQFFAYEKLFRGGASLAIADVNKDGLPEIITGAGPGGAPHVRSFSPNGTLLGAFYGLDEAFRGGIKVATVENLK